MQTRKIPLKMLANDIDDERHNLAIERFGSLVNVNEYGELVLAEVKDIESGDLKYVICGAWESAAGRHYVPVAEMFMDSYTEPVFMLPDGEGGYVGEADLAKPS